MQNFSVKVRKVLGEPGWLVTLRPNYCYSLYFRALLLMVLGIKVNLKENLVWLNVVRLFKDFTRTKIYVFLISSWSPLSKCRLFFSWYNPLIPMRLAHATMAVCLLLSEHVLPNSVSFTLNTNSIYYHMHSWLQGNIRSFQNRPFSFSQDFSGSINLYLRLIALLVLYS